MVGLRGMGNYSWAVGMVKFNCYMFCVNVVSYVHYCRKG